MIHQKNTKNTHTYKKHTHTKNTQKIYTSYLQYYLQISCECQLFTDKL